MSIREFLSGYGELPPYAFTPESFKPGGAPIDSISAGIVLSQPRKLAGAAMGDFIGKVTGWKPCVGCKKVEDIVDGADRLLGKVIGYG